MSTLQIRLADLITAIGTDYKLIWANSGVKASLTTADKSSLVAAINEVNAKPSSSGGASIADGDDGSSLTTTYSANKIKALNDAQDAVTAGKVDLTSTQTITGTKTFNIAPGVPNGAWTIAKTASLQTALDTKPTINDSALATATLVSDGVWSPAKVTSEIQAVKTAIIGGAAAAYDTLMELQTAIQTDDTAISGINTALANRVRFDAAQSLTAPQKVQAKANIDAYGALEIGNPDTDLVALYTTAKA